MARSALPATGSLLVAELPLASALPPDAAAFHISRSPNAAIDLRPTPIFRNTEFPSPLSFPPFVLEDHSTTIGQFRRFFGTPGALLERNVEDFFEF